MNLLNKFKIQIQIIILYTINFQIIAINCQEYVSNATLGRAFHTATLVEKKIYFLGGFIKGIDTNHFFSLDISNSLVPGSPDKNKILPFEDLTSLVSDIPSHNRATTSVGGSLNESIFLFGGNMRDNYHTFNTIEKRWRLTITQGNAPIRKTSMNAATDMYGKTYLFGGAKERIKQKIKRYNDMTTFDTISKIWNAPLISLESAPSPRDGYTATYIPTNGGNIFYIGGFGDFGIEEIVILHIYDTTESKWSIKSTIDPPKGRVFHTAVLTSDNNRIIIFGGADNSTNIPVKSRYEVLDVNAFQWYHGTDDVSTNVPFRGHTATLFKDQTGVDHMLIAFGMVHNDKPEGILSSDIIIYRIGDYAKFTEVHFEQDQPTLQPNNENIKIVAIGTASGLVVLGIAVLIIYKKFPKIKNFLSGNVPVPTP